METNRASRHRVSPLHAAFALSAILLRFALAVAWHIELPGLYMDAVNPDYMVVDLLNGVSDRSPIWYLPGNLVRGRIPLLTAFYHGTMNMWLALPFVAMFGPGVAPLRTAQAVSGAAILVAMFYLLLRARRRDQSLWLAAFPVAALALDPAFVYSFRNAALHQPQDLAALLLAAWLAAERGLRPDPIRSATGPGYSRIWLVVAGACYGLKPVRLFPIYGFFAQPALLLAIVLACRESPAAPRLPLMRVLFWLGAGLFIGVSPYLEWLPSNRRRSEWRWRFPRLFFPVPTPHSTRLLHICRWASVPGISVKVLSGACSATTGSILWMFAARVGVEPGTPLKLALLLFAPLLLWIACEVRGIHSWRLRLSLGMFAMYPLVALVFGDRLAGHHFIPLLPVAYLMLGIALIELVDGIGIGIGVGAALKPVAIGAWLALVARSTWPVCTRPTRSCCKAPGAASSPMQSIDSRATLRRRKASADHSTSIFRTGGFSCRSTT